MPLLTIVAAIWGNPLAKWSAIATIVAALCGASYIKGFYDVPRVDIPAVQRAAAQARDAQWRNTLDAARKTSDDQVVAALGEAQTIEPTPPAPADRVRLCRADPNCRDRSK